MFTLKTALLLAGVASAAPTPSCPFPTGNFHLVARSANGTDYPLSAEFPAEFTGAGTQLQFYASMATPYKVSETSVFAYNSTARALTTLSKQRSDRKCGPDATRNVGSGLTRETSQRRGSQILDTKPDQQRACRIYCWDHRLIVVCARLSRL